MTEYEFFKPIRFLLREKNGKKLVIFSVVVFLLVAAIVFFAAFQLSRNAQLDLMHQYIELIPRIIESRRNELPLRSRVYEDDILTRAELGLKLYRESDGLTDTEKLERVRGAVSADSLSLLDGQGQLLSTTGPVSPEANFRACVQALEPRVPRLELYTAQVEDGTETGVYDGKGFVMLDIPGNIKRSLVFEFSGEAILELYNALDDWSDMLEKMLSGGDMAAFVKIGDKLSGYPMDDLTSDQSLQLYDELSELFQRSEKFRRAAGGKPSRFVALLGGRYLAELMHDPQENMDILMTIPAKSVIRTGIYSALVISAIIGYGMLLFQRSVLRRLIQQKTGKGAGLPSPQWVRRTALPAILAVLAVSLIFSAMLLLLETRTNSTLSAVTRRESLQHEIDWRKAQEDAIRSGFAELYRARTQMLADFLTVRPDYQTHAGLQELSDIAGTDYLMRFDSAGQELFSSNSYTGFSVGTNLSEAYRAVLMGYPYAVVGPAADPYTGQMQLGTASLMTDEQGQPDGFLLAIYSTAALNAELERLGYENTVNSFSVQKGHVAAAVSDEDGRFIAHTDPAMIGKRASDFLVSFEPGKSFEGFDDYNGQSVCLSASSENGRTLLFMVPERVDSFVELISTLAALALLLILLLLYYPTVCTLSTRAIEEAKELPSSDEKSLVMIFAEGYFTFLTVLAILALIASSTGRWPTFVYVFSGQWSKGVHLFSLWAALFTLSVTLCIELLILAVLNRLESRFSLRAKTIIRLANSLISYSALIFLVFCILDMFGVNTTTLLASAGIISIAVGMGAQSMASDLLAGFFLMMEGSVHVGDHVRVAGIKGYVTDMGIRTTEITDEDGNIVILNNSQVNGVCNMSRNRAQQELDNAPESGS